MEKSLKISFGLHLSLLALLVVATFVDFEENKKSSLIKNLEKQDKQIIETYSFSESKLNLIYNEVEKEKQIENTKNELEKQSEIVSNNNSLLEKKKKDNIKKLEEKIEKEKQIEQKRIENEKLEAIKKMAKLKKEEQIKKIKENLQKQKEELDKKILEEKEKEKQEKASAQIERIKQIRENNKKILEEKEKEKQEAHFRKLRENEKFQRDQSIYVNNIKNKIMKNWVQDFGEIGWNCRIQVIQNEYGTVMSFNFGNCHNNKKFRESIKAAVYKSMPLPMPERAELFDSVLNFDFLVE